MDDVVGSCINGMVSGSGDRGRRNSCCGRKHRHVVATVTCRWLVAGLCAAEAAEKSLLKLTRGEGLQTLAGLPVVDGNCWIVVCPSPQMGVMPPLFASIRGRYALPFSSLERVAPSMKPSPNDFGQATVGHHPGPSVHLVKKNRRENFELGQISDRVYWDPIHIHLVSNKNSGHRTHTRIGSGINRSNPYLRSK